MGKTTACGKLARLLQQRDKKVLMVATDVYRPAAIDQLVTLGRKLGVDVFEMGTSAKPPDIAKAGLQKALREGYDSVIVDTAGRLQVWAPVPPWVPSESRFDGGSDLGPVPPWGPQ